jgi:hypothetical protein
MIIVFFLVENVVTVVSAVVNMIIFTVFKWNGHLVKFVGRGSLNIRFFFNARRVLNPPRVRKLFLKKPIVHVFLVN